MEFLTALGPKEISENNILNFDSGILGFKHLTKWGVIDSEEEGLNWLISLEDKNIAFILWDVRKYIPDYDLGDYKIESDQCIYAILTIRKDKITANLVAPIIIDEKKQIGFQHILTESGYSTQTLLYTREAE